MKEHLEYFRWGCPVLILGALILLAPKIGVTIFWAVAAISITYLVGFMIKTLLDSRHW